MTDNFERALQERLLARSQVSPRDVDALRVFARTLPARRRFWRGPAIQWALSAAAIVLTAVVVLPMLFRVPGFGTDSPAPPTQPAPTPGPATPAPTASPIVPPPTPVPSIGLGPIRLAVGSGSVVNVLIEDPDDLVTGADAEQAAATMSVRWFDSIVEEADAAPNAIRITWVGFPRDETVELQVSQAESGQLVLHFIQAAPPPNSDGEGEDRVMVLELADPIDPSDVEVTFAYPE